MIRRARPEDMPAITHVRTSVVENHLSVEQMAERGITREAIIADIAAGHLGAWVAEEQGDVVAFAMADQRNGSVFALFTKPGCEGRGHGSALLAYAEAWLASLGHRDFWLSTGRGTRAEKFYVGKGWSPSDETAGEPDDVILRKMK